MLAPVLALMLGATPAAPPSEVPDRALLEFLAEFAEDEVAEDDGSTIDPLWLATADAAAELDRSPKTLPQDADTHAENDDDRPR